MQKNSGIELRNIRKYFGSCRANEDVTLHVAAGSIHAVVGENGAGKSTAMKILYGQFIPDEGQILVEGQPRHWRSSADAIRAGLGMVHQHFMLADTHSVLDNILLGTHSFPFLRMGRAPARRRLESLMKEFGLEVPLDEPVGNLPVGVQQRAEILKLLYQDSRFLILDEPTAVLAPLEVEALFRTLRNMAAGGKTILIITHKLKEVMALAERVTVFRAGRVVGESAVADTSAAEIAALMVGRELTSTTGERKPAGHGLVLEAVGARAAKDSRLGRVSFRLREGEILGVAGVEGNGQTELLRLLLDPAAELGEGRISFRGQSVAGRDTAWLREEGAAVFPEDRLKEALLLGFSLEENFMLGQGRDFGRFWLKKGRLREEAAEALKVYDVRPGDVEATAASLSGGNQQKFVVARELRRRPRLLLASQPTRGVDIGAIEFIHGKIMEVRNAGTGVLLFSSELDEVLKLSDRLLVMFRGQVVGAFSREEFDEKKIGGLMAGNG